MSIANEWFVDYYNQLIVHAQLLVFYTGTGGFTIGETVTWSLGAQSAIVVAEDATNDRLFLVYNTNTPTGTITGATSGATCTFGSASDLNSATFTYTGTGGFSAGDEITFNTSAKSAYVVSDDTTNNILIVKYVDVAIASGDTVDTTGETVDETPTISKTTYTTRQLYSFLQDTFDELDQLDDTVPMSAQTPTEFTMINGWFIDDDSTQYLSGGAISTSGWADEIRLLTFDGYTSAVRSDIGLQVLGSVTTDTGTLLHYNNTDQQWWVRMDAADDLFDNDTETVEVTTAGGTGTGDLTVASQTGETLYANIYTLGTIQTTPNPVTYVFQNGVSLNEWWGRGDSEAHIDVLIKVSEVDTEIDGANITVFVRHFGDLYDHFTIDLSSGGRNAVPLATQADLNNSETGEQILSVSDASSFNVGNFVLGDSSGTSGEILALDTAATPDTITIGNVVGTAVFTDSETINETIDGTANGETGVTTSLTAPHKSYAVAGYSDVGIYFVNVSFAYISGSTEPTLYETITEGSASGILVDYTLTSGTWGGGDAAGVITVANWNSVNWTATNDINGSTSGSNFASVSGTPAQTIVSTIDKAFEQGTAYPYNIIVNCAGRTMAEVYEWFKYVTREDANSSAPSAFNHITMYRVNDAETAVVEEDGEEYISAKTTYTPVKASPFGTFAGGKLFGARGVWVENMDNADRQNFQLIDANNDTRVPPNFITITVNSVVSGDKVSVFRTSTGTTIAKTQFNSHDTNNSATDTTFEVEETIPSDTPSSGYIRVVDTSDTSINRETRYAYSSWTGSIFTLSGATQLDRTYENGDTAYVPYFDELAADTSVSVTVIYNANQSVLTRVRQYDGVTPANSILPFQITGTVTTSGYTVAAIRTADTIVTAY
jgi:hypothetical protein